MMLFISDADWLLSIDLTQHSTKAVNPLGLLTWVWMERGDSFQGVRPPLLQHGVSVAPQRPLGGSCGPDTDGAELFPGFGQGPPT